MSSQVREQLEEFKILKQIRRECLNHCVRPDGEAAPALLSDRERQCLTQVPLFHVPLCDVLRIHDRLCYVLHR